MQFDSYVTFLSLIRSLFFAFFFFFNDTATTEIYTLSLHDALPILSRDDTRLRRAGSGPHGDRRVQGPRPALRRLSRRSEEHTSELQSQFHLVCRLLLEKKKQKQLKIQYLHIVSTFNIISNVLARST